MIKTLGPGKIFVGIECEGQLRGMRTLFVKDFSVPNSQILQLAKQHECGQIYLGAGKTDIDDFQKAAELQREFFGFVTIEIQNPGDLNVDVRRIVLNNITATLAKKDEDDLSVTITEPGRRHTTLLSDKNYEFDEKIL